MSMNKQKTYNRNEIYSHFADMYDKKLVRYKLQSDAIPEDWKVEAFMDGPLTFVALTHPCGATFTGWSKFNPSDSKYTEHGGLFRALQKAIDKYADELAYTQTWGFSSKESVSDEVCSNQSSGIAS